MAYDTKTLRELARSIPVQLTFPQVILATAATADTHIISLTENVLIIIFLQLIYLSLISITKLNQFLMIISLIYIFKRHIS